MRWQWKGIFSVDVPDDWEVRELGGGLVEIVPPEPFGAAEISVVKRHAAGPVKRGEAAELGRSFALAQGARQLTAVREHSHEGGLLAQASFTSTDPEGDVHWELVAIVSTERAFLCTYCHDGSHEDLKSKAILMFMSLKPGSWGLPRRSV